VQVFRVSLTLFMVLLFASLTPTWGDDLAQSQSELQVLNKELKALQSELAKQQKDASAQRRALRSVEKQMGELQTGIVKLAKSIEKQELEVAQLKREKINLQQRLDAKQEDIQAILRLAYKQNNQPLIKLLLSGERPEDLSRHLYYFSVLTKNQQRQLENWVDEQNQLSETIIKETTYLDDIRLKKDQLTEQSRNLALQKNKRAQVVANIENEAETTAAEITRKESEREKMSELIAQLQAKLDSMSLDFPETVIIGESKGKLPWPVDGRLQNKYGRSIDGTALKWQGWLIAAPNGSPVRAVSGGRVVFADFFKSNGLLIIVDHGNGIWTLYGRNRSLLSDVGSWVEAGDVIAEVGQSGGYNQSGLYFEVRKKGEPENPASWLTKR